jgi:(1->4)-alpha-D-glucan 1-alpha-D-glucosylmutase
VRLAEAGWGNTVLPLPDGSWTDRLSGAMASGPTSAAALFADLPVVLLERDHG